MLLVNVGNTHTQFARRSAAGTIRMLRTVPTESLDSAALRRVLREGETAAVASVVPRIRAMWGDENVFYLDACAELGIAGSSTDLSNVGADRLANICEAARRAVFPALVLDFGTAITGEWIDRTKTFRGGFIAPGRRLMRQALHDHTAQLPLLEFTDSLPIEGNSTRNAMRIGIDLGCVGLVRELIDHLVEQAGGQLTLYTVGGDRKFFAEQLPSRPFIDGGAQFTLSGLAHARTLTLGAEKV